MLYKFILICCLFVGLNVDTVNASTNVLYNTVNAIDSTVFSAGLVSLVICLRTGDYARTDLTNSLMHIRVLLEMYRIMRSSFSKKTEKQSKKSEAREFIKVIDAVITSAIFLKYGQLILSQVDNLKDRENFIPLAFGLRCLAHLRTTTQPILQYIE